MSDPYVGKLTYFRVYSGTLDHRRRGAQRDQGPQGAHRPHPADAREPPRGQGRGRSPATSSRPSASRTPRPATRSATPRTRSCSSAWSSPSRSSRWRSSPRPRSTRTSWARRSARCPRRTRPSRSTPTTRPARRSSRGMGELHLEVLVDRMMREFSVDANVGKPQVAYRETITQPVEKVEERYVRQTGGRGQYGHVVISLEPTGPGGGYEFVDEIKRRRHPARVHPRGRRRHPGGDGGRRHRRLPARRRARAILTYGSYHDVDSLARWRSRSPARWRSRKAARKAKPVLLEPIDGGRGRHARGLHGRRDRRPQLPAGPGRGHGAARQRRR